MTSRNNSKFVVNLVSNASTDVYPNNTISSFTTQLPDNGIHLDDNSSAGDINNGSWEVALLEISYPMKFFNILNGQYTYNSDHLKNNSYPFYREIPKGSYTSVNEILHIMYVQIKEIYMLNFNGKTLPSEKSLNQYKPFEYSLDEVTGVLSIKLNSFLSRITLLSPDLRVILGMPKIITPDAPAHIVLGNHDNTENEDL